MRILTGSTGTSHITAADDGALYAGFAGEGSYVLNLGQQFRATVQSATSIKLGSGDGILQGRHFRTDPGDSDLVSIDDNSAGTNRNDIIGVKYSTVSGIESMAWQVIKGAAVSGTASDPTYSEGDLLAGGTAAFMPMYRVRLEGAAITAVEPLFTVLPALTELTKKSDAVSMSQVNSAIQAALPTNSGIVNLIYPVGSIYMSVNSASPATLFGGTWERIKDTFLLSAGDTYAAGATGGEAEHALTAAELPDHAHHAFGYTTGESDWAFLNVKRDGHQKTQVATSSSSGRYAVTGTSTANVDNPYFTKEDEAELEGAAHNNMPPYLAVYVWKRTA